MLSNRRLFEGAPRVNAHKHSIVECPLNLRTSFACCRRSVHEHICTLHVHATILCLWRLASSCKSRRTSQEHGVNDSWREEDLQQRQRSACRREPAQFPATRSPDRYRCRVGLSNSFLTVFGGMAALLFAATVPDFLTSFCCLPTARFFRIQSKSHSPAFPMSCSHNVSSMKIVFFMRDRWEKLLTSEFAVNPRDPGANFIFQRHGAQCSVRRLEGHSDVSGSPMRQVKARPETSPSSGRQTETTRDNHQSMAWEFAHPTNSAMSPRH